MIDSHCHLDHEPILSICTTINSFEKILKIINFDPIIYGTFGIHPHECSDNIVTKEEIINNV